MQICTSDHLIKNAYYKHVQQKYSSKIKLSVRGVFTTKRYDKLINVQVRLCEVAQFLRKIYIPHRDGATSTRLILTVYSFIMLTMSFDKYMNGF